MSKLMDKAKVKLLLRHVFFASLALSTPFVVDRTCPTAWTDMTRIGYNPEFIESLGSVELVIFVILHELYHIMFMHGLRRKGRDPQRWNRACDYAINLLLKDQGFTIWQHALIDEKYRGKTEEQIYDELVKKESGRGRRPGEGDQEGFGDDVREPEKAGPEERAKIKQKIEQKIAQAASFAKMAGKLSADLERIVGKILNPPLPWPELLAEYMTQITHDTENWSRRNRRNQEVYLPTRRNERMGELGVLADTSGSVGPDNIADIQNNLNVIADTVRPERMRVAYFDTQFKYEEIFEEGDPLVLNPKGGGGTDMRVAIKYMEQFDPIVVVLITDGETPWPDEEPPYPLIVVCSTNAECPVGRVVRMRP